jgi:hypothetical protein
MRRLLFAIGSAVAAATLATARTDADRATLTDILTDPQYRVVIHALEQRQGVDILAEPQITLIRGRQGQMEATDISTIIASFGFSQGTTGVTGTPVPPQTNPPPRRPPQAPVVSPEVHPDRTVTFRVRATNAASVIVSGEFRGGRKAMTKDDRGVWSATVGPVEPDIYQYSFQIDGLWMLDPANPVLKPMRTPTMSLVEVPPDTPQVWDFQPVPHGVIRL